ncbi:MAG: MarR family transcriptional regulator [Bacteroidetes bacterium]|nr:MarR family transcriptional regulator [Bacteroidota bacterium]MDA1119694.1 MarR family transcriptional regulator [Bacteroidota bacterium]
MKKEESIDYNIKTAWHAISRMYNQYGQDFGLTASTGFVLLNIDFEEGTPATKIAPLMGLEARSLTRVLKSLEERELIYRQPDEIDGRSVRIFLTKEGKKKREIARRAVMAFNEMVVKKVGPRKMQTFFEAIVQIQNIINDKKLIQETIKEIK